MAKHGSFYWTELATDRPDSCRSFYTGLFGWSTGEAPVPQGTYTIWKAGDMPVGGMLTMGGPEFAGVPSHWLTYFAVRDVDASAAQVPLLGGVLLEAPFDVPEVGRIAVIRDPSGATIALITPAGGVEA